MILSLAKPPTVAQIGDELNQCLQIIMTTAENMGRSKGQKTIIAAVDRAARAVRALAPFVHK